MRTVAIPPVGQNFRSLGDQVYEALLQAIVERRFKPGQRLTLDDLASQMRVSRTPVRDALVRLANEGLVETAGRWRFRVTALSEDQVRYLNEARLACELFAIEKGIGAATPGLLEAMRAAAEDCSRLCDSHEPADRVAWLKRDREFHSLLVGLAANPTLSEIYRRINIHAHHLRLGPLGHAPESQSEELRKDHLSIVQALAEGDEVAARAAVRRHVANAIRRAGGWARDGESSARGAVRAEEGVEA